MLNPSAKSTMGKTNLNSKTHSYYRPLNFIFCSYSSNNLIIRVFIDVPRETVLIDICKCEASSSNVSIADFHWLLRELLSADTNL